VLLLLVLFKKEFNRRKSVLKFVNLISKWSMADVFVVGVFIAFLSLQSNKNISAELHSGFYYFLSYCVISIASAQLIRVRELN
jgi:paraquat-inducible protein A